MAAGAVYGLATMSVARGTVWETRTWAVGVARVTVWALMLGVLRWRSGGLVAPMAAHIVADTTIAVLVLTWWS